MAGYKMFEWDEGVHSVQTRLHVRREAAFPCDLCGKPISPGDEYIVQSGFDHARSFMLERAHVRHFDRSDLLWRLHQTRDGDRRDRRFRRDLKRRARERLALAKEAHA